MGAGSSERRVHAELSGGRWEYRPGSTAYLVYSHAQGPAQDDVPYEPRALTHGPAADAVLLKLSWAWLR